MTIIRATNLTVRYGATAGVKDCSFELQEGEFVALVGQSGSGKSTLAHALCGFIPHEGAIERPAQIGMVFQSYALFPFMTCRANVALGLYGLSRRERHHRAERYLEMVGLSGYGRRFPWQLSGGQAQRIAVARALAPDPPVVVMDEPFAAVDVLLRETLGSWLAGIMELTGKSALFISHSVEESVWLSDRVLVMHDGRIQEEFHVEIPRPRRESLTSDPKFIELCRLIRLAIVGAPKRQEP